MDVKLITTEACQLPHNLINNFIRIKAAFAAITGTGGSSVWGGITGTITDQTDLVSYVAGQTANGNTAFGWGNHASAGYLTGLTGAVLVNGSTPLTADWEAGTKKISLTGTAVPANTIQEKLVLANTTAAAATLQQLSPAAKWTARGWATTPVASRSIDFRAYVLPIQGAAAPTAEWVLQHSVNGAAFTDAVKFNTSGKVTLQNGLSLETLSGNPAVRAPALTLNGYGTTTQVTVLNTSGIIGTCFQINNADSNNLSGTTVFQQITGRWIPGSGTGVSVKLLIDGQINQTGGANGAVRGIYYNPTLTAVVGTHTAFENTSGDVLLCSTSGAIAAGGAVNGSAILTLTSTAKGFLPPRMTKTQRNAILGPATGLVIFQTDNTPGLRAYNGTNWMRFTETTDA